MQIEVGEYKTRGGEDVTVVAIVDSIAIGYYAKHGPESVANWRADNGRFFVQTQIESAVDLVSKKPKRIKREVWLTVYRDGHIDGMVGWGYATKKDAQENMGAECIAIAHVVIDCVEGENLD